MKVWAINADERVEAASGGVLTYTPRVELQPLGIGQNVAAQLSNVQRALLARPAERRALDIGWALGYLVRPWATAPENGAGRTFDPALWTSDELVLNQFRAGTLFIHRPNAWTQRSQVEELLPLGAMLQAMGGVRLLWVDYENTLGHEQLGPDLVRRIITDRVCRARMPEEAWQIDPDELTDERGWWNGRSRAYQAWKVAFDGYAARVAVRGLTDLLDCTGISNECGVIAGGWMGSEGRDVTLRGGHPVNVPSVKDDATWYVGNAIKGTSPRELFDGVREDVKHLRILHRTSFAVVPKFDVNQRKDLLAEIAKHCAGMGIEHAIAWANDPAEAFDNAPAIGRLFQDAAAFAPVQDSDLFVQTGAAVTSAGTFQQNNGSA